MKIQRLILQDFRCFAELELAFEPGLNIIQGPNGVGKSTIQRAMLKTLFDRPSRTQANLTDQAWGADQLYTLTMEFADHIGQKWTVSKNFQTSRAHLQVESGESWTTGPTVQQELARCIGTDSSKLFASSLFVAQSELAAIQQGREDISLGLEARVTGGESGVNTTAILKRLDTAITDYRRGYETSAYKNLGPIAELVREEETLAARVVDLRQRAAKQEGLIVQREKVQQRLLETENELGPGRKLLEQLGRVRTVQAELTRAEAEEGRLEAHIRRLEQAQQAITSAEQAAANLGPLGQADTQRHQELERLVGQIEYLQAAPIPEPYSAKQTWLQRFWLPVLLIVLGIAVFGVVIGLATVTVFTLQNTLAGLAGSGILALAGAVLWGIAASSARREASSRRDAYARATRQRREEIQRAEMALQRLLASLGCRSPEEYREKVTQSEDAAARRARAEVELQTLLGSDRTKEDWDKDRQAASRKRRDCNEELSGPDLAAAAKLGDLEAGRLERAIHEMSQEQAKLQDKAKQLDFHIQRDTMELEELLAGEEGLVRVREDLTRRKRALEVYQLTREMLITARQQTVARVRRALEDSAGRYFRQLTHDRYGKLTIDDSLSIAVTIPGHDGLVLGPDVLSCGTQDQLYFAVRLALIDLLFSETNPPIFLDDPFVTFDRERQQAALELCREIAETRQVFLFTCNDQYSGWGHVIGLAR